VNNLEFGACRAHVQTVGKVVEKCFLETVCILARRKFKNQVPSSADGYMPFPSLIGKFERPDYVIMAFALFSFVGRIMSL
jgi:hypothetical protein